MKIIVYINLFLILSLGNKTELNSTDILTSASNKVLQKEKVLIGELNVDQIEKLDWYSKNYNAFSPKEDTIAQIKSLASNPDLTIEVYFGTWCPDSQYEVPKLIKLLHLVDFNMDKIKLVGLGRDKKVPNISPEEAKNLDIQMIPTFVFFESNNETNRFVEFAVESLEEDILAILANKEYKHSYKF